MANKRFYGKLRDPLGELANLDKLRFTHVSTTGEVLKGSISYVEIDDTGDYDFNIEYGNVLIESKDRLSTRWINQGVTTINSDTVVTTLPGLLNALVPPTDEQLIQFQNMLDDALNAADRAEAAADEILQSGEVNYTSGNINFNDFGGVASGDVIAQGVSLNNNFIVFYLPINSNTAPTSITVNGTFSITTTLKNITVVTGVTPTLFSVSSNKIACIGLQSAGASGLSTGDALELVTDSVTSKITVNF